MYFYDIQGALPKKNISQIATSQRQRKKHPFRETRINTLKISIDDPPTLMLLILINNQHTRYHASLAQM